MIVKSGKINPAKQWLVYILKCGDGSYYTGITNCLTKRLKAHAAGVASKYTRSRLPVKVVYLEILRTKGSALRRELKIKKLSLEQKILLIKAWGKSKKPPPLAGAFFISSIIMLPFRLFWVFCPQPTPKYPAQLSPATPAEPRGYCWPARYCLPGIGT